MNDGANPRGPARLAHQYQAFAGPPRVIFPPAPQVYPDQLQGKPRLAHTFPFLAKPVLARPPLYHPPIYPDRLPGRPALAHRMQAFATPAQLAFGYLPGYGAAGAATFVLSLQPGTKITYSWSTDIFKSYSGNEQRCSPFALPRQRIEGTAFLLDASSRDTRGALQRAAAAGSTFLIALPYEELVLAADSVGTSLYVDATAACDWAQVTQRVAVLSGDGSTVSGVIQQVTATTIRLDVSPGATGRAGGRIMPLVQVLLDPAQGFARYPVTVDLWSIRAQANVFGWAGVDSMGIGTQITTYTVGGPVDVGTLTDAELIIWDRPNAIDGTASESMLSGAELVDLGALPFGIGGQDVPDWVRSIRYSSSDPDDWQWFKAFVRFLRGRQGAFLLSTNRDDLEYVGPTGTGIEVVSAASAGAGDYASWFASLAHRRLAVTLGGGAVQYVTVTGLVDNHDGTLSLTLDAILDGSVTRLSLLEQVRLEGTGDNGDGIEVTWDGGTFTAELTAIAVQETIVPPSLYMFDTVIDLVFTTGDLTHIAVGGDLGRTTLINYAGTFSRNVGGILANAGPIDGQVVCLCGVSLTNGFSLVSEDATLPANQRFWSISSNTSALGSAIWYRFDATAQRWKRFFST